MREARNLAARIVSVNDVALRCLHQFRLGARHCGERGLPVLDARLTFDSLASAGASLHAWFMPGGHYSPHGNAVVACLVQRRFAPALADTLATGMRSCVDRILREPDVQRPVAQHHQRPQ